MGDFYNSTDWDIVREHVLIRDKFACQFFNGNYTEKHYKPSKIQVVRATHVHHIEPIKERPDLCLDADNLVALSHTAHEIFEGRNLMGELNKRKQKKVLTTERW